MRWRIFLWRPAIGSLMIKDFVFMHKVLGLIPWFSVKGSHAAGAGGRLSQPETQVSVGKGRQETVWCSIRLLHMFVKCRSSVSAWKKQDGGWHCFLSSRGHSRVCSCRYNHPLLFSISSCNWLALAREFLTGPADRANHILLSEHQKPNASELGR